MKIIVFFITYFLVASVGQAQNANNYTIKGKITDKVSGEPIVFSKVLLYRDSLKIAGANSDLEGHYEIKNIHSGQYMLAAKSIEFEEVKKSVVLKNDSSMILTIDFQLDKSSIQIEEVQIVACRVERNDITVLPARKRNSSVVASVGGVNSNKLKLSGSRRQMSALEEPKNSESYNKIDEHQFSSALKNPLSTFSIDVDKAAYSNVRRYINGGNRPPVDAVRIEELINYFPYNYPKPKEDKPFSITTAYSECPWNREHKLAFIALQGKQILMTQAKSNNLVFLIDVSGSMQSADKLDLLKAGLFLLVDQMREEDQISIVTYAGNSGVLIPSTSGSMKVKIKNALEGLSAGGSTAGGSGIELAYKIALENFIENGNNRVILATDGDFNVGISSENELVRLIESKRNHNIYLSVLGFGTGNLQDAKMEQLADKGNGNYNYIDNIKEAKKVLVNEMGGTLLTIAKDVKLQVEFNPTVVKGYRLIGYENRYLKNEDFNNDKVDAGDMGSGHSVTAIYEIIPSDSKDSISSIDDLKYQKKEKVIRNKSLQNELMTVKVRFKEPNEHISKLMVEVTDKQAVEFENLPKDFQFSSAVAAFGKYLRNSEFKGNITSDEILKIASNSLGEDKEGYRKEFIELVKKYMEIHL